MKYKLISKTLEETICSKVVVDRFDYYVSDDYINKLSPDDKYHTIVENPRRIVQYSKHIQDTFSKVVICSNNPNIDLLQVIDKVEELAELYYKQITLSQRTAFRFGYSKSQETHSFSEEDMLDFGLFCANFTFSNEKDKTRKELLNIWKSQQPKILYYG